MASCLSGVCACSESLIRAMDVSPLGSGGAPMRCAHVAARYSSITSVSERTARWLSTPKDWMNESSTACGNLSTSFSAPPSGDGSAPARSVSQWTK